VPCSKIWDTFSGECLQTLQHNHIVRSTTFSPTQTHVATGGAEKKLRVFDLSRPDTPLEVGPQVHGGTIKSIVWSDPNTIVSASDDKKLRWWDVRSRELTHEFAVNELIGSCELSPEGNLISATAGKSVYFFESGNRRLIKSIATPYEVSSVALHQATRKFITGGSSDTWVRVYDFDTEKELEVYKGHHGSIWSVAFSPDGKLYATGSEDGTIKLVRVTSRRFGEKYADAATVEIYGPAVRSLEVKCTQMALWTCIEHLNWQLVIACMLRKVCRFIRMSMCL
jgi:serine-threonine kinase receptor-associated protein